jgi:hypothetical protein
MKPAPHDRPYAWVNGYVYFVRAVGMRGPVKIGWAKDPQSRLKMAGTWSPVPLEIAAVAPGPGTLETTLHKCFAEHHLHGEWFHCCEELQTGIERLAAGAPIDAAFDLTKARGAVRPWRVRPMQSEAAS